MQAQIDVAIGDATLGLPVVIGCPFRPGELTDASNLSLQQPDGAPLEVAARPLLTWPDGSIRWALLAFAAKIPGLHTIGRSPLKSADSLSIQQKTDCVTLSNRLVTVQLSRTAGPIRRIEALGRVVLDRPEQLRFEVDDASTTHDKTREIRVLEANGQRARVRVEGAHFTAAGRRKLSYHLDVELWAGWPTLRLDYHFFNLEPGAESLAVNTLRLVFQPTLTGEPKRHYLQRRWGPFTRPRAVVNAGPVALRSDFSRDPAYVEDRAMLLDDTAYPHYLQALSLHTDDWLGIVGNDLAAYLRMDGLTEMKPKRIASDGDTITLDIWPTEAGPLQLPQGRSRRQTITLAFAEPTPEPAEVRRLLMAPLHEGRATIAPVYARHVGVFDVDRALSPGASVRFEKYLNRLMTLNFPTGMWDLGDNVEDNYTRNYIATGRQPLRPGVEPRDPMQPVSPYGYAHRDVDRHEPVWANNEYDLIHALCLEIARTGRTNLVKQVRDAARHNIEVDFIHYSDDPWQHHGSPAHSALHHFASAYPSHLWTQGLLEYYCLSGDPDALYVAELIGQTIIRNLRDAQRRKLLWGFNREVGWPVLALVHLYDYTRKPIYAEQLDEIVAFLMAFDRAGNKTPVNLSGVNPRHGMHRQIVSGFFGYASMVEGLDRYARITGREDLRAWLTQLLRDLHHAAASAHAAGEPQEVRRMITHGMAIGYELTGEEAFLRTGMVTLEEFLDTSLWTDPPGEFKAIAMIHRALTRFLHHAHTSGMLKQVEYRFV
jgi:hypothetical protein